MSCVLNTANAQVENDANNPSFAKPILEFLTSIRGQFSIMETDVLGNLFLIQDGQLKKISPSGDTIAVYNDVKRFGQPSSVDATNPFKTLLYYKPYSTIVILDNMLAVRGVINLRKNGIFNPTAIGTSYDNKLWVFDDKEFKLKKLNDENRVLFESTDLRLLTGEAPVPQQLFDNEGKVYLYDSLMGFIVLDYYGAYEKTLHLMNWHSVNVRENHLSGIRNDSLLLYTLKTPNIKEYPLPTSLEGALSASRAGDKLYIRKRNRIDIYKINLN